MDITVFMTWFINQVVTMFTWMFNTLDSITFMGTSLLKLITTIMILIPLMSVVLTISKNVNVRGSRSERVDTKGDSEHRAKIN